MEGIFVSCLMSSPGLSQRDFSDLGLTAVKETFIPPDVRIFRTPTRFQSGWIQKTVFDLKWKID